MNKTHLFGFTLAAMAIIAAPQMSAQAISLSDQNPIVSENFDGTATEKNLPEGWRIDRNMSAPRTIDTWDNAVTDVMYAGSPNDNGSSASLASNAKNGTYFFVSSDTDRAVGGLSTGTVGGSAGTRGVSPMVALKNNHSEGFTLTSLTISYNVEKYRNGTNSAGFAVQLYTSTDGIDWTSAGDDFRTFFAADANTTGAAELPITTSAVTAKDLKLTVEAGSTVYLAWNISVASGNTCSSAQGLAIDNVVIEAAFTDPSEIEIEPDPVETESRILLNSASPSMSEDFDTMFANGEPTLRLPDAWRVDRRLHKDGENYWLAPYSTASRDVMYAGGVSLASNAANGSYNFASSPTSTDRAVGGLSTGTGTNGGNSTKCINVMTALTNNDADLSISRLSISYDIEKYRNGSNSNGFGVQLYTSTDGETWVSAGDDFYTYFPADAATNGAAEVPIATAKVENRNLAVHTLPGETLYLAWQIAVGNHVKEANAAQGLAIDNVAISATFVEEGTPVATSIEITPAEVIIVPNNPEKVKVLSLNNSLIDYNAQYNTFNSIAQAMGKSAIWTNHTNLGQPLSYHYAETGDNSARNIIAGNYWSHIILQEHSSLPRTDISTFRANVAAWVEYIRANCPNPNAVIIMPVNWAYDADDWANFTAHNDQLLANYASVAAEYGITLCPVARAYQMYFDEKGGEATHRLYSDNRHPTPSASYMAACMEYQLIFGEDASTITYTPALGDYADMAEDMRHYASLAFNGFANPVDHNAGTATFSAKVLDQFGQPMASDAVEYSAEGGRMDANVFTLTASALGNYAVTASAGEVSGNAKVIVAEAVEPAPLEEELVVNGYLNINFKSVHLTGETDTDNRPMGIGAPYTVTLATDGTVVYRIDYSAAANIANAPKPQIWKGNFYNMTNEGAGIYSYTFDGAYSQGDEVSFSRYVRGGVDENKAIKLIANEPVELGNPASITLNASANVVMGSAPVALGVTVRDAVGHNLNSYPSVAYTCTNGATLEGNHATVTAKGSATITATMEDPSLSASVTVMRITSNDAVNLALKASTEADDLVKNNTGLAVDGNIATQVEWTISAKNEEHYLSVDLGTLASIEAIELVWEGASATVYDVNLSRNGEDIDHTFAVTNGGGGAGVTVHKYLYTDDFTAVNTRYVTVNTHTVYEAGWGMKLKEIAIYGVELAPVKFNLGDVNFVHEEDKKVTIHSTINHVDYDEVVAYNVWVIDRDATAPASVRAYAPAAGEHIAEGHVVGSTTVTLDDNTGSKVNFTLPLTELVSDDAVHHLAVRAQAVMSDGTTVNSTLWNEGDADGATDNEYCPVDTSKNDGTTGIDSVIANGEAPIYINLHGARVDTPSTGVYIRLTGSRAEKVIVR